MSSSRRDANGTWLITPVFLQQTRKLNAFTQSPYIFDTFNIDSDNSAKLATCRLESGTSFYPELDYDHDFKIRILRGMRNGCTIIEHLSNWKFDYVASEVKERKREWRHSLWSSRKWFRAALFRFLDALRTIPVNPWKVRKREWLTMFISEVT